MGASAMGGALLPGLSIATAPPYSPLLLYDCKCARALPLFQLDFMMNR